MPELADIFRRYRSAYLERLGNQVLPSHRRAIDDITHCRTEVMGGHLAKCDHIDCDFHRYSYHSCRNRSCPKCHTRDSQNWLEKRCDEILPGTRYFHQVFTLPRPLHPLVYSHQKILYGILMKAAAYAVIKLALDPKYVGGKLAVLCILHTWSRALMFHPHVHMLIPAGGYCKEDHEWIPSRSNYLVPVKALSVIFRARFMAQARKALPEVLFPEKLWNTPWVVYSKPAPKKTGHILNYLARYVHRVAITNRRILSLEKDAVTFHYKDSRDNRTKTMSLPVLEFMRRFLEHVLPAGFHKVRYFGLLSPACRPVYNQIKFSLALKNSRYSSEPLTDSILGPDSSYPSSTRGCPKCGLGILIIVEWLPPRGRGPP